MPEIGNLGSTGSPPAVKPCPHRQEFLDCAGVKLKVGDTVTVTGKVVRLKKGQTFVEIDISQKGGEKVPWLLWLEGHHLTKVDQG